LISPKAKTRSRASSSTTIPSPASKTKPGG
jgi:hypothetical protein